MFAKGVTLIEKNVVGAFCVDACVLAVRFGICRTAE